MSVAITDSSDMRCFDWYLINIFMKSTKAERCIDIMFKLTLHCLGAQQEHDIKHVPNFSCPGMSCSI